MTASGNPWPSWNLLDDFREMWSFPFMVNAFRAGTLVALTAGVIGWFVVTRKQSFAAHTLAMVSFPGAAAALYVGVSAVYGYFVFCIGAALVLAAPPFALAGESEGQSAATGTVQAFLLACGYLFIALYHGLLSGLNALLFGTFLGRHIGAGGDPRCRLTRRPRDRGGGRPAAALRVARSGRRRRPRHSGEHACPSCSSSCSAPPRQRPARSPACCSCSRCS